MIVSFVFQCVHRWTSELQQHLCGNLCLVSVVVMVTVRCYLWSWSAAALQVSPSYLSGLARLTNEVLSVYLSSLLDIFFHMRLLHKRWR